MFRDFPAMFDDNKGMVCQGALIEAQALTLNLAGWIQAVKIGGKIDRKSSKIHPFGLDSTISTLFKVTICD